MKRKILMALVIVGYSGFFYADTIENNDSIKVDNYIDEANLTNIPPELEQIIDKEKKIKSMLNEYSSIQDKCNTLKLNTLSEQLCKDFSKSKRYNELKANLQQVLEEKERIKTQASEIIEIPNAIQLLEEQRKILESNN